MATIEINRDPSGQTETLDVGEGLLFGRSSECEVVIDNSSVSGKHAWLRKVGHRYLIIDLRSTNGVMVNRARIREKRLHDGDVFHLAEVRCVFHDPLEEKKVKKYKTEMQVRKLPVKAISTVFKLKSRVAMQCPYCGYIPPGQVEICPRCEQPFSRSTIARVEETRKTRRVVRIMSSLSFAAGLAGPILLGIGWMIGPVVGLMVLAGAWQDPDPDDVRLAKQGIIGGVAWFVVILVVSLWFLTR
ncbi:MAG: FHA domain-containing protein [Spartobacteria bacterium]|nr:FHA domain-containing protein [Spartobacteria bacterium]